MFILKNSAVVSVTRRGGEAMGINLVEFKDFLGRLLWREQVVRLRSLPK